MTPNHHDALGEDSPRDPCDRGFVEGLLVFAVTIGGANKAVNRIDAGEDPGGGLGAVLEYVKRNRSLGALLEPLHPELALDVKTGSNWQIAIPDLATPYTALSAVHVLEIAPDNELAGLSELKAALLSDDELIAYVHRPAIRHPLCAPTERFDPDDPQWGLAICGFEDVWGTLEASAAPRAIGIIDTGDNKGHPELDRRIPRHVPDPGMGSNSDHAAAVAGVIAAIRNPAGKDRMKGCCSAELHLYNVWTRRKKFDPRAYYRALRAVAGDKLPVLNLSIGWTCPDPTEQFHIDACISQGVVVVAAMGNKGKNSLPHYPAACEGVIAVGGTTRSDVPVKSSSRGAHIWLSAPGERIMTITGMDEYGSETGTSYAAPFVTAAVWLARRKKPCLDVSEIRKLLKSSVACNTVPKTGWSPDIGHGRLDMLRLVEELEKLRDCPADL